MAPNLMWKLASLLSLAATVYAAGDEDVFEIQPEIHHTFRPADKMPPVILSQIFTLLALSPWLLLIVGWFKVGMTPAKILQDGSGNFIRICSVLAFVSSLLAVEYLFYLYWVQLDIFQTLKYFAVLSITLFLSGQRALSHIKNRREGLEN